jgi:hypothetical protein
MTPRQHSGTQALNKTGKTRAATATPLLRGRGADMAVWCMRRLQALPCEHFALFHADMAIGAATPVTAQMIVETTCCAREGARMR